MDQPSELAKAEAELTAIDGKLAELDRQRGVLEQRRSNLKAFVQLGRSLFGTGPIFAAPVFGENPFGTTIAQAVTADLRQSVQRDASMKARILDLSKNAITMHGSLHTVQLVKLIEDTGLQITGKDKNVTVSVILSRSPEFVSDRSRGWSLAEKTPQDVAASAGSSTT
jgi:hypothetical protein